MATTSLATTRPAWGAGDRIALVLLLVAFALSTPVFGIETRSLGDDTILNILAAVLFVPPAGALVLSWRLPATAAKLGLIGGCLLAVLSVLDLFGLLIGTPPAGMIVLDLAMAVTAAFVAWRSWRLIRG